MRTFLEIWLPIILIIAFSPFAMFSLAKMGYFMTHLESGDIKFIMRGKTLLRIINDTPGKIIVGGMKVKSFLNKRFGLYWVGFPPFSSVHKFEITKEKENPAGQGPENWISGGEKVMVSSLRFTFPRPYVMMDVELKDRIPIHILVVVKLEVVDPYIPVFNFKGAFFENAGSIIKAAVGDVLKTYSLDEFLVANTGEVDGILSDLKKEDGRLNEELIRQVGLRLVGISIPKYDPTDKEVRAAMNAETIAKEHAKAIVEEAKGVAEGITIRAEAQATAEERLAVARGARVRETASALATAAGGNSPEVAQAAASILEAEALAGKDSKIITLVKGGTPAAVMPVGGIK